MVEAYAAEIRKAWVAAGQPAKVPARKAFEKLNPDPALLDRLMTALEWFKQCDQWRKDGAAIPGATAATFTLPAARPSDAGGYSVVVSNGTGSVTSGAVTATLPELVSS